MVVGGAETLLQDSLDLAEKAEAAGVTVELHVEPHEVHDYPYFRDINPRARGAMLRIGHFIQRRQQSSP